MNRPVPKVPFLAIVIIELIAFSLIIIGWNTDVQFLLWTGCVLVLSAFFVLAYQALRKSLDNPYPAEGSSPETWRSYH